ncbi:hypothetical protein, partial [uncultured Haemophilus sp.]|uniref:hypothetical protein n=1 Tax=uncultured Haemophilus sp. TaxID=237779 RepID=UPI0027DDD875
MPSWHGAMTPSASVAAGFLSCLFSDMVEYSNFYSIFNNEHNLIARSSGAVLFFVTCSSNAIKSIPFLTALCFYLLS